MELVSRGRKKGRQEGTLVCIACRLLRFCDTGTLRRLASRTRFTGRLNKDYQDISLSLQRLYEFLIKERFEMTEL